MEQVKVRQSFVDLVVYAKEALVFLQSETHLQMRPFVNLALQTRGNVFRLLTHKLVLYARKATPPATVKMEFVEISRTPHGQFGFQSRWVL